jgi:hypothetical protein
MTMTDADELRERLGNEPRFHTADGTLITPGLPVWDDDWRLAVVDWRQFRPERHDCVFDPRWDGWFATRTPPTGERGKSFNGERLCVRHPKSRQRASEALHAAFVVWWVRRDDTPCPACGAPWRSAAGGREMEHELGCAYLAWLEAQ